MTENEPLSLCPVCQHDCRPDDVIFTAPCQHELHRECAHEYVNNFRLNCPGESTKCPLCKAEFDSSGFPDERPPEELAAEQLRRRAERQEAQVRDDHVLARDLFFEEFGVHALRHRRGALRRAELEIFFWLQPEVGHAPQLPALGPVSPRAPPTPPPDINA